MEARSGPLSTIASDGTGRFSPRLRDFSFSRLALPGRIVAGSPFFRQRLVEIGPVDHLWLAHETSPRNPAAPFGTEKTRQGEPDQLGDADLATGGFAFDQPSEVVGQGDGGALHRLILASHRREGPNESFGRVARGSGDCPHYVFLLDPWWNPAVEAQAIDRTHRIGQSQPVFAYRLIARDTVEEKILELQQRKKRIADAVLGAEATPLRGLTVEEVDRLLS